MKNHILIDISIVVVVWIMSIFVSSEFVWNHLALPYEYQTAHTLVSMRAFEQWGFWKLLGASHRLPFSMEFQGMDIIRMHGWNQAYLSYPSFWLNVPYFFYKIIHFCIPHIELSPLFIRAYNVAINRLGCGVFIFLIFQEFQRILLKNRISPLQIKMGALLGMIAWMFSAHSLVYSQHIYTMDTGVLLPIYGLTYLLLKNRFILENMSRLDQYLILVFVFLASGMDWFGFVMVLSFLIPLTFMNWKLTKRLWISFLAPLVIWFIQLAYYDRGISFILSKIKQRSLINPGGGLSELLDVALDRIPFFIPSYLLNNQYCIWGILLLTGFLIYFISKKMNDKKNIIWAFLVLWIPVILHMILLSQHTIEHVFSSYKMAILVSLHLTILPWAAFVFSINSVSLNKKWASTRESIILCFGLLIGVLMIKPANAQMDNYMRRRNSNDWYVGQIIKEYFEEDDLIMGGRDAFIQSYKPVRLWYANRFVYYPLELKQMMMQKNINIEQFNKMKPVYLKFKTQRVFSEIEEICEKKWELKTSDKGIPDILICRDSKLIKLFN